MQAVSRAEQAIAVRSHPSSSCTRDERRAMARAPISRLLSLSRRGYAASAGAEVQQRATAAMAGRISGADGGSTAAPNKEIFWMRDPKTGYWIPENQFAEVDAAELRAQLLTRKG